MTATRLLKLTLQAILVDSDDAGEIVSAVVLEPVEMIGRRNLEQRVADHLAAIDQLCTERGEEVKRDATDEARLQGPLPAQER